MRPPAASGENSSCLGVEPTLIQAAMCFLVEPTLIHATQAVRQPSISISVEEVSQAQTDLLYIKIEYAG